MNVTLCQGCDKLCVRRGGARLTANQRTKCAESQKAFDMYDRLYGVPEEGSEPVTPAKAKAGRKQPKRKEPAGSISRTHQAWNAARSVAAFLGDGCKFVDKEVYAKRIARCDTCPHRNNTTCRLCGCYVNIKAKLNSQTCPIGKWADLNPPPTPFPFPDTPILDLFFHVYPVKGNGVWEWNVGRLLPLLEQFNGARVLAYPSQRTRQVQMMSWPSSPQAGGLTSKWSRTNASEQKRKRSVLQCRY